MRNSTILIEHDNISDPYFPAIWYFPANSTLLPDPADALSRQANLAENEQPRRKQRGIKRKMLNAPRGGDKAHLQKLK